MNFKRELRLYHIKTISFKEIAKDKLMDAKYTIEGGLPLTL
ncbi:hypothetical protein B0I27_10673 [Arcticibacter pallidicorallinus]|uniref:Uncharacterized protein n=1 Tax=Arcticibacter pallidicorallinus TaxID=1259464 RepID=A0A2T0U318_9SPHI|nr:hypothetical protein B0I27_10673 [Arcticibacter pallidicorallinus]